MSSDEEGRVHDPRPVISHQNVEVANDIVIAAHRARLRTVGTYDSFWNGTIPLDEAARKGLILRRIDRSREAVELQHERLTKSGDRHMPDLHFYVFAVRNLLPAVRVLRRQYPERATVVDVVEQALHRFGSASPDLDTLRDLVEHFDEYDHMAGKLQKSGAVPKLRMGQVENPSLFEGDAQLSIYTYRIMVSTTTGAALQLAEEVLALKDQLPG